MIIKAQFCYPRSTYKLNLAVLYVSARSKRFGTDTLELRPLTARFRPVRQRLQKSPLCFESNFLLAFLYRLVPLILLALFLLYASSMSASLSDSFVKLTLLQKWSSMFLLPLSQTKLNEFILLTYLQFELASIILTLLDSCCWLLVSVEFMMWLIDGSLLVLFRFS